MGFIQEIKLIYKRYFSSFNTHPLKGRKMVDIQSKVRTIEHQDSKNRLKTNVQH